MGGALGTLDDYLEQVQAVFASPQEHVGVAALSFRVNRMGIKLEPGAAEAGDELSLLELSMGTLRRVAVLVRCPRRELLSIEQFLGQVNPHLAAELGIRPQPPG
jgi:hypothetical protein